LLNWKSTLNQASSVHHVAPEQQVLKHFQVHLAAAQPAAPKELCLARKQSSRPRAECCARQVKWLSYTYKVMNIFNGSIKCEYLAAHTISTHHHTLPILNR
jgi:hypothetical protein